MSYSFTQKVLFKHCDPAGIVFFPRYFEMMNDVVEAFFTDVLASPFEAMHPETGAPTASIDATFPAPSRHGDVLDIVLTPTRLGGASLTYEMEARCGGERRFVANGTLVHVRDGRPVPWPDSIRAIVTEMIEEGA